MYDFDLSGLFFLAIVGLIASVITVIGGGAWLVWFLINHVRLV